MGLYVESLYKETLYPAVATTKGLIAHWPLDELTGTNVDEKVANNDGTLVNTTDAAHVAGIIENAIEEDGVSDHMTYQTALINRDIGTITHWVFPDVLRRMATLYESDGTAAEYNGFGSLQDQLEIHLGMNNVAGQMVFNYHRGASSEAISLGADVNLVVSTWSHCGVTYNINGDAKIYINGVIAGTEDLSVKTFSAKTTTVRNLGRVGDGATLRHWQGKIDDTRVYSRVLSDQEMFQVFQSRG